MNDHYIVNLLDIADDIELPKIKKTAPRNYIHSLTPLSRRSLEIETLNSHEIAAFAGMVTERIGLDHSAYLMTIMFNSIPGSPSFKMVQMKAEAERVFRTFIARVNRNTHFAPEKDLPLMIGAIDLPVK